MGTNSLLRAKYTGGSLSYDTWYVGQIDGEVVRVHGYAHKPPQSIIDKLVEENYSERVRRDGKIKAARWVIERQGQGCGYIADRLIELQGFRYFAKIAGLDQSLVVKEVDIEEDELPF